MSNQIAAPSRSIEVNSNGPWLFEVSGYNLLYHFPLETLQWYIPGMEPGNFCKPNLIIFTFLTWAPKLFCKLLSSFAVPGTVYAVLANPKDLWLPPPNEDFLSPPRPFRSQSPKRALFPFNLTAPAAFPVKSTVHY